MASEKKDDPVANSEASEKPIREQLKKASISTATRDAIKTDDKSTHDAEKVEENVEENGNGSKDASSRGRPQKKRSLEDIEDDGQQELATSSFRPHTRKRSRGSSAEEDDVDDRQRKSIDLRREAKDATHETRSETNGHVTAPSNDRQRTPEQIGEKRTEASVDQMTSPKTKRSRLHATTDDGKADETASDVEPSAKQDDVKTEDVPSSSIPASSGFANTSAVSPFASFSGSKSQLPEKQTSASAFAASGFGALTGTSSGFGAIGKSSGGFGVGGGFATSGKSPQPISDKSASLEVKTPEATESSTTSTGGATFGGALGQQSAFSAPSSQSKSTGFASSASGFGALGGSKGFGSSFGGSGFGSIGGTGSLTSFASGKPAPSLSAPAKPARPFGAPAEEDEEEGPADNEADEVDESGFRSPLSQESEKQDERFYEQELETGEEEEQTEYSCRAKLYSWYMKKEWKERGLGVVRLNVMKPNAADEEAAKPKARLLMRADGSHRVILNTPIKKEIRFGAAQGGPPQGGYIHFMGTVDGSQSLTMLQFKIRPQFATELYEKIVELQEAM